MSQTLDKNNLINGIDYNKKLDDLLFDVELTISIKYEFYYMRKVYEATGLLIRNVRHPEFKLLNRN